MINFRVEVHHFLHKFPEQESEELKLLRKIFNLTNNMPSKQEFQQALADVTSALDNIAADITRLTDQLAQGGLSDADEQEIFTQLRAVADRAKTIADTTVDPEVPPTPNPEPIKLTEEQLIADRIAKDGESKYGDRQGYLAISYGAGYIAGATAERERNKELTGPELAKIFHEQVDAIRKEERNRAIDDIINYLGSDINDNDHVERYWPKLKSELEEFKSLKSDSK